MKNYELLSRLMELPAGADIKFVGSFEEDEMCFEDSTGTVERDITDIDLCGEIISLM